MRKARPSNERQRSIVQEIADIKNAELAKSSSDAMLHTLRAVAPDLSLRYLLLQKLGNNVLLFTLGIATEKPRSITLGEALSLRMQLCARSCYDELSQSTSFLSIADKKTISHVQFVDLSMVARCNAYIIGHTAVSSLSWLNCCCNM